MVLTMSLYNYKSSSSTSALFRTHIHNLVSVKVSVNIIRNKTFYRTLYWNQETMLWSCLESSRDGEGGHTLEAVGWLWAGTRYQCKARRGTDALKGWSGLGGKKYKEGPEGRKLIWVLRSHCIPENTLKVYQAFKWQTWNEIYIHIFTNMQLKGGHSS